MGARVTAAWECRECGVRATFAPGFEAPRSPAGWVREGRGWTCLGCARAAARLAARSGDDGELERLIDAELRRGLGVNQVAKATGADALRVRKRRTALVRSGEVEAPAKKPPRDPAAARARRMDDAADALRRLGEADHRAVARELGTSETTARRRLRALVEAGRAAARVKGDGQDSRLRIYRPA